MMVASLLWTDSLFAQTYNCPQNLTLQNVTITSLQIHRAQQQIALAGNGTSFIVQGSAADAKVFAGQSIDLNPGTHLKSGSKSWMRITPCSVGPGDDGGGSIIGGGNRTTQTTVVVPPAFRIYPNPTGGQLTVTIPDFTKDEGHPVIEVYHLLGHLVLRKKVTSNKTIKLDFTNQPKGIYLIKLITNQQVITRRIVRE